MAAGAVKSGLDVNRMFNEVQKGSELGKDLKTKLDKAGLSLQDLSAADNEPGTPGVLTEAEVDKLIAQKQQTYDRVLGRLKSEERMASEGFKKPDDQRAALLALFKDNRLVADAGKADAYQLPEVAAHEPIAPAAVPAASKMSREEAKALLLPRLDQIIQEMGLDPRRARFRPQLVNAVKQRIAEENGGTLSKSAAAVKDAELGATVHEFIADLVMQRLQGRI